MKEKFKNFRKKYGRKALYAFLVYFVAKWTLTIFFGARLIDFFKDKMP
ncbi:MAG: hypothetical protein GYB31_05485 [Bacteroidetes bacterium]|nr:hypothetical protein [Bacteroidota bacterium]